MMMARPRTAGTAARRKQRALAVARARAESRQEAQRPQSRAQSTTPRGSSGASPNAENAEEARAGPSMGVSKVLFGIFIVCLIIGAILVALTTLEDAQLGSTKLVGILFIVVGSGFLVASFVVCLCQKVRWAAQHSDDVTLADSQSTRGRRSRYAANHVEDETTRPPTRAWNLSEGRPASSLSTGTTSDIDMTLTAERQNALFSGAENGGFQWDMHNFRPTPEIKITCEEDDGKITTAADIEGSRFEDVAFTMAEEGNKDTTIKPTVIPPLDLSAMFPSPSLHRKSFQNEGYNSSDEEAPPLDSAASTATVESSTANSPCGTQLNKDINFFDNDLHMENSSLRNESEAIELKTMKSCITESHELRKPETPFKDNAADKTDNNGKLDASSEGSPNPDSDLNNGDHPGDLPFDLGLLVSEGRGGVE